jgi:hypothetical protein
VGGVLGGILGIGVAAAVGAGSAGIAACWLSSLGTDSNRVAAAIAFLIALPCAGTLLVGLTAVTEDAKLCTRGWVGAVLAIGALVGLLVGAFVGGLAGVQTALQQSCVGGCYPLGTTGALESGVLVGSWVGGVAGLIGGGIVAPVSRALARRAANRAGRASTA